RAASRAVSPMGLLSPVACGCPPSDQPRAVTPAARAHPRARAALRSLKFPSMVMDLPKEVPKSAACGPLARGEMTSFQRGLSFAGDFLEIFNTAMKYRLRGHDRRAAGVLRPQNEFTAKHPAASP